MKDRLDEIRFYQLAMELWNEFWEDAEKMKNDIRGKEIVRQLTRSIGSISANIEEGFGRGFGKEYPMFLKFSRGSARESKGWYIKSSRLLSPEIINARIQKIDLVIGMLINAIRTIESKKTK